MHFVTIEHERLLRACEYWCCGRPRLYAPRRARTGNGSHRNFGDAAVLNDPARAPWSARDRAAFPAAWPLESPSRAGAGRGASNPWSEPRSKRCRTRTSIQKSGGASACRLLCACRKLNRLFVDLFNADVYGNLRGAQGARAQLHQREQCGRSRDCKSAHRPTIRT